MYVYSSRPLGDLQFLRIWHDNSGLGPNGSWYLSFIVFRDVQTGKKFEFIANNWLAVEHGDGQVSEASSSQLMPYFSPDYDTDVYLSFSISLEVDLD